MTKTIKSETSNKHYFLTIDETGHAVDCSCPDCQYRHHACKHMTHFNRAFEQAITFMALLGQFDVRSQALIEAKRAAWWNFEMQIAA